MEGTLEGDEWSIAAGNACCVGCILVVLYAYAESSGVQGMVDTCVRGGDVCGFEECREGVG